MAKKTFRFVNASPIRPPAAVEAEAKRRLLQLAEDVQMDLSKVVGWILEGRTNPLVVAYELRKQLDRWNSISTETMATEWVEAVDSLAKTRLEERLRSALGVQTVNILDDDKIRESAVMATMGTAGLIRELPREYIQRVTDATIRNYQGLPFPDGRTLAQELAEIEGITKERARFIARQQTSVINAAVNQTRQQAVGIEEYFWSSSRDLRTVGNPNGLYRDGSKGHGDHWARDYRNNNGKAYRWDEPFDDGLPGQAFNCRCTAIARINTAAVNKNAVIVGGMQQPERPNAFTGAA